MPRPSDQEEDPGTREELEGVGGTLSRRRSLGFDLDRMCVHGKFL